MLTCEKCGHQFGDLEAEKVKNLSGLRDFHSDEEVKILKCPKCQAHNRYIYNIETGEGYQQKMSDEE